MSRRPIDYDNPTGLAARFRKKRFKRFEDLIDCLPRPIKLLDVGGTLSSWQRQIQDAEEIGSITILNTFAHEADLPSGYHWTVGDATDMSEFSDGEFDVVFSNSVIEHVGEWNDQCRMAREISRVGRQFFVQTPNRHFPVEPHFMIPFWQYLPVTLRVAIVRRFDISWYKKKVDRHEAEDFIRSFRLLTRSEMRQLFPGATIEREKVAGLTKSFIVHSGFTV